MKIIKDLALLSVQFKWTMADLLIYQKFMINKAFFIFRWVSVQLSLQGSEDPKDVEKKY